MNETFINHHHLIFPNALTRMMPRSQTGAMMTVMLALALIALPLADASKLTIPADAHKAGMERVRGRILEESGYGSFQVDCSGDGTINYYTDAQCTSSMGTSVTLASLHLCDEDQTTYTCDAGTPRFTYFANSGCTGDSITGLEFLGTACYTEADLDAYMAKVEAEMSTMDTVGAVNCGNSCAGPTSGTMYSMCRAVEAGRASGCFDDCASVPANDLATVNTLMAICDVEPIMSGSVTVKTTFVVMAALAAVLINL